MLHERPRHRRAPRRSSTIKSECRPDTERRVVFDFLQGLGTPRALSVWLLYSSGEHRQLVELQFDPLHYLSSQREKLRSDYAASKLLSKCAGLLTGIDVDAVALSAAEAAELQCKVTNHSLRAYRRGVIRNPEEQAFLRAQQIIARILGAVPSSFDDVGWSTGRTTSCSGAEVSSVDKYSTELDVTSRSRVRGLALLRDAPHWGRSALKADGPVSILSSGLNVVKGNEMRVVPKNAKTGRVICFEPHVNIRLQLAVGGYIRKRLLRNGVNLNDQSINQRRARFGSRTGSLATIDLKAASDTMSSELVYDLLPVDWAILLDDLRSHYTKLPSGLWSKNEKFSSMGNGFTFELESLIFYALASAVTSDVSVYGDDVIVPSTAFEDVCNVFRVAGFAINTAKSFSQGFFRESCGMDAFCGLVVTPPFLRTRIKTVEDILKFHNSIRDWVSRDSFPDRKWSDVLRNIRVGTPFVLGPSGKGDGHYHVNLDEASPSRANFGLEGWWYTSWVASPVSRWEDFRRSDAKEISPTWYAAVLCASTGPKRPRSVFTSVNTGRYRYDKIRGLAAQWPSILWFS